MCCSTCIICVDVRPSRNLKRSKAPDRWPFRGRSVSDSQPVIDGDISIDLASDIYAVGSVTFILAGKDRAGLHGFVSHVGYAARINEEVTVDLGVAGYRYTQRYGGNTDTQYAEIYAGISTNDFALGVYYTTNYFDKSIPVLYTELNFIRDIGDDYTVKAHTGLLAQTSGPARLGLGVSASPTRYDTRLAVSRPLLALEVEFALTYAGALRNANKNDLYYGKEW